MTHHVCVREHMTPVPAPIELGTSLSAAATYLRRSGADTVPVTDGGALSGLLFDSDIALAQELGVSPHDVLLRRLPLHDVYVTTPEAPLSRVAEAMAMQKVGSAIVLEAAQIVGVLSWHAALSALAHAASASEAGETEDEALTPSGVRSVILLEHQNIRRLLCRLEQVAHVLVAKPLPEQSDVQLASATARTLCAVMESHFEFENRLLVPALERLDAWGSVRAERLRAEHREQVSILHSYVAALDELPQSGSAASQLSMMAQQLVDSLRKDMQAEEATLLRADFLCDDAMAVAVETG